MSVMCGKKKILENKFQRFSHTFNSTLVYYLSEGFKVPWFTTLVKDSRYPGLLP